MGWTGARRLRWCALWPRLSWPARRRTRWAVVRRRMQLGLCAGGGVLQGVRTIAREEGVWRLYAGLGIAYVKAVPSAAIGLVAYDQMKALSLS